MTRSATCLLLAVCAALLLAGCEEEDGAPPDLGRDGLLEAGPDAARDRGPDAVRDAALDLALELGPDLGLDGKLPDAPLPPTFTAPVSWSFESSCQGLAAVRDWECGALGTFSTTGCSSQAQPPKSGHSGKAMWGTKLNSCYSSLGNEKNVCSNQDITDDSILSFKVTLPSSWSGAHMAFWSWEDYFLPFDWAEVRVDGTVAWQSCSGTPASPMSWARRTVDLSTKVGQTVTVAFHFMASLSVAYAGWYLDDLSVGQGAPTDGGLDGPSLDVGPDGPSLDVGPDGPAKTH